MAINPDEEPSYFTHVPAGVLPTQAEESTQDEANFDTLKKVQSDFRAAIDSLHKDFNAFDIHKDDTDEVAKNKLLRDIDGRQIAYDILSPLLETLDNTVNGVESKYK